VPQEKRLRGAKLLPWPAGYFQFASSSSSSIPQALSLAVSDNGVHIPRIPPRSTLVACDNDGDALFPLSKLP
jgi:hypothetical protein